MTTHNKVFGITESSAMPELPEPELGYVKTDKSNQPAFSARQMRAALQAQPAEVSDAEIERVARSHGTGGWQTLPDMIRFARTALALRPQAVPEPEWIGGEPANLQAAARDADEWLALIQRLNDAGRWRFSQPDSRAKLDGCRAALSKILCADRPQAVPMTLAEVAEAHVKAPYTSNDSFYSIFSCGIRAAEAHHRIGITAPAGGEG